MALFNYATKEITLKVVYYGPGLSGKTTNIEYLHSSFDQARRGKLLSLSTETDRTLFFDFLPIEIGKIRDFSIRFQVYTVPGQVRYNATRKLVLKGADAIVFVADSQVLMRDANLESVENMRENLMANDLDPDDIPIMFQYNKRDLPNILSIEELNNDLNHHGQKYFPAVAIAGSGVKETFQEITRDLIKHIAKKHRIDISMREQGIEQERPPAPAAQGTSAPALSEPAREPELPGESPEEEPVYHLEESDEVPEARELLDENMVPSDYFGTIGEDEEDVTIEVIDGLQNQEELMEESTHFEGADLVDEAAAERIEGSEREQENDDGSTQGMTGANEEIEDLYKAFISEEKGELPTVDESVSETLEREELQREEDNTLLKTFRESIKAPKRDDGADREVQPEEYDIFAELEKSAREEEERRARERDLSETSHERGSRGERQDFESRAESRGPEVESAETPGAIEPALDESEGAPSFGDASPQGQSEQPPHLDETVGPEIGVSRAVRELDAPTPPAAYSERTLSATESLILDEINTISRTLRKIHDSMNSLKSETVILTGRLEELEKRIAFIHDNSREVSELLRSGGGKILSDEIAQAIMSLKASVDMAKKKRLWMLFS